jgi:peptide/nickel transport system permease protein
MTLKAAAAHFAKRVAVLILLMWLASIAIFGMLYASRGNAADVLLGNHPPTPDALAAVKKRYHLDQPLPVQYQIWAAGVLRADFGTSIRTGEPALAAIKDRFGVTLFLGLYAYVIAILGGVALGILAALRQRTVSDRAIVGLSVVGVSSPAFVTGILLIYLFAVLLPVFPPLGEGNGLVDELYHLTLPALTLALTGIALIIKLTRAAMITALEQDYVAFARARGLSKGRVVVGYAFRNSLNPVVTGAGLIFSRMLFGTVLVEVTFALPGLGNLLVESINYRDVPMVQAIGVLTAGAVILVNLVTDIMYFVIDPRVRATR